MVFFQSRVFIEKPVEQVFSAFTNEKNFKKWIPGLKHIEQIRGIDFEEDSKFSLKFSKNTKILHITSIKKNQGILFTLNDSKTDSEINIHFVPEDNSTHMIIATNMTGKSFFQNIKLTLFPTFAEDAQQDKYDSFKKFVESTVE